MYSILRFFLFLLPAEMAHYLALDALKFFFNVIPFLGKFINLLYTPPNTSPIILCGLSFSNRVGLAAGLDKNAQYLHELALFGFGFIEIGTVTPLAQAGNPRPRLFRIVGDKAIINRMGFNNDGVDAIAKRLAQRPPGLIIGGNIGKNKDTLPHRAIEDYLICFRKLFSLVDYFVVNVSSPNTPGLRTLQEKKPLRELLSALQKDNTARHKPKPVLLKIAPDLSDEQLKDIAEITVESRIAGLIVSNTTLDRTGLHISAKESEKIGNGGLSGQPLREKANEVLWKMRKRLPDHLIIGVGGIINASDAADKIKAGADLVQLYTGFVYNGPKLITESVAATEEGYRISHLSK